jgi:hypothetical protein
MDKATVSTDCNSSGCGKTAAIVLAGQDLCLDHFFACCYEQLDKFEARLRQGTLGAAETSDARVFLEECSNRVLFVSMRSESLNNLERSRLLEILLSCGDLQRQLRRPARRRNTALFFGLESQRVGPRS